MPQLSDLVNNGIDNKKAFELFTELEFTALIKKLGIIEASECNSPATVDKIPETTEDPDALINLLSGDYVAVYYDGSDLYAYNGNECKHAEFDVVIAKALSSNSKNIVCYDAKSIYEASGELGVKLRNCRDDVMLGAYVLDSQGGHDIDRLVSKYLNETLNPDVSKAYYVYRLAKAISDSLESKNSMKLYREIELPLAAVLADMEEAGFLIDIDGGFGPGKADVGLPGQYSGHDLIGTAAVGQLDLDAFLFKIPQFHGGIEGGVEDRMGDFADLQGDRFTGLFGRGFLTAGGQRQQAQEQSHGQSKQFFHKDTPIDFFSSFSSCRIP
jgi:hypothetical protein